MTEPTPDPFEQAGRELLDLIDRNRATGAARAAGLLGLLPDADPEADPEPGGWTADEWADLMRRKAEHAAQMAEREAAAIHRTGAAVEPGPAPASAEPMSVADALLRDWRGGR